MRFTVTDTGIGIPHDKQAMLFAPFTQVDSSTTRHYGGTGLGLAISKQLAELMGGAIGLESEEGRGSTFWFTATFGRQTTAPQGDPAPLADLAGAKVLVVDDHPSNRLLAMALLKGWGCRASEARNGQDALALLADAVRQSDPYAVALVDMQMPGMDGAELARRIKADPEMCKTRLIVATSLTDPGNTAQWAQIGFAAYLTKPLRQSQLHQSLQRALGKAGTAVAMPAPGDSDRQAAPEATRRPVRILVAEDNVINQLVALGMLKKLGYRADAVANGQESIAALQTIAYDLVLMDCQMPEMDGFEATRAIRSGQSGAPNQRVPIIALTAHAMRGDRERCLEAGMSDYLTKPIQPAQLAAGLERWLDGGSVERSPVPEAEARPDPGVFDREAFLARAMGDEELLLAVTEAFLADMPLQIEKLSVAVEAGDSALTEQQAHSIKGASATVSANALRAVALAIENAGRAGDVSTPRVSLPQLLAEFERLRQVMAQLIGASASETQGRPQ
ncbi:MAG: response regulator [Anaerolineae bacterium]